MLGRSSFSASVQLFNWTGFLFSESFFKHFCPVSSYTVLPFMQTCLKHFQCLLKDMWAGGVGDRIQLQPEFTKGLNLNIKHLICAHEHHLTATFIRTRIFLADETDPSDICLKLENAKQLQVSECDRGFKLTKCVFTFLCVDSPVCAFSLMGGYFLKFYLQHFV